MEKAIKKGYLIADLNLEFDSNGNIKSDYEINGLVKDNRSNFESSNPDKILDGEIDEFLEQSLYQT